MKLTNEDVQEILQLLDATKYNELHIETERFKLTLRRSNENGDWSQESQVLSTPNVIQTNRRTSLAPEEAAQAPVGSAAARETGLLEVCAHLPGTFYRAPKPGAAPFVEIETHVEKDSVVALIETMKLMNAVLAETRGKVVEICAENAQFVQKGAVLMRLRPEKA